jgi:ComF family protein
VRNAFSTLITFALPPRCPACGVIVAADHLFCLTCWNALDFLGGPACAVCAEPLGAFAHDDARCGACLADPPPFETARAAVAYGPIARALALKLKYRRRTGLAVTMARLMRRRMGALDDMLVVPVPLHRRRLWGRGFNQSALIARALVSERGGVLAIDALERRKATPVLRGLGPSARARAVAGAFAISPDWADRVKERNVLLVDDVYTTGATISACARQLKRAGAGEIHVLCWARVVRNADDGR